MAIPRIAALAALALIACSPPASAEIIVSANDGKQVRAGESPESRTPDSLSVIELSGRAPRIISTLSVPTSMIGPPTSVAMSPNGSIALATAAQRLDASDGTLVLNDSVSVIDLSSPAAPRLAQTLHAGPGATGVAVNRTGTLALVASTGDDSVSVFSIAGRLVTPAGRLQLPYQSRPTDVAFSPDGRTALVVAQSTGKVLRLAINDTEVAKTGIEFLTGVRPYGVTISRDGNFAFVTNLGGRTPPEGASTPAPDTPRIGTIAVLDLNTNTVANIVDVGATPEHLVLSPDGAYLQVTVVNGSSSPPTSPNYNAFGLMRIFRVEGSTLSPVAESQTGQWCQGAAWSDDSRLLLLQCAIRREIEVYRFNGRSLTRDTRATLTFDARPGSIVTARGR